MSDEAEKRARIIATRRLAEWRRRLAERLSDIGGVDAMASDDGVVVSGRRLKARWLRDARLRWIGGWL